MSRLCSLAVLGCLLPLALAPAAYAEGRPPDAGGTACTYRVAEAPPYDTPQGHVRVHYVGDPADRDSPAAASTRVGGVPDWIVSVGESFDPRGKPRGRSTLEAIVVFRNETGGGVRPAVVFQRSF